MLLGIETLIKPLNFQAQAVTESLGENLRLVLADISDSKHLTAHVVRFHPVRIDKGKVGNVAIAALQIVDNPADRARPLRSGSAQANQDQRSDIQMRIEFTHDQTLSRACRA